MTAQSLLAHADHETFELGPLVVPRIWTGLWQLSSNAWGSAPTPKIRSQMASYAERGYTAFGKFIVCSVYTYYTFFATSIV